MGKKMLIKNGKLFDGTAPGTKDNIAIEMVNGMIAYVGEERNVTGEYEVIDASGKFLMPGIIDCHMHIGGMMRDGTIERILEPNMQQAMVAVGQAAKAIEHGITTVCDVSMAGIYLKRLINMGEVKGPGLIPSGQGFAMGGGGPYVDPEGLFPMDFLRANHPWGEPCDGADNLRHGVRMRLRDGCSAIKVWTTGGGLQERIKDTDRIYTDEEITALCDEASMAGIPVIAHCESPEGTKAALRCGVKGILHGLELDEDCIRLFIEKGAWFMPTLKINLDWIDKCTEEELLHRKGILEIEGDTLQQKEYNRILLNFQTAYKKGVKIALASDTYCNEATPYGQYTLDEIKAIASLGGAGVYEALLAATKYAAEALGISDTAGTIEKDKIADILILDQDITRDINLLNKEHLSKVIKGGKIVE